MLGARLLSRVLAALRARRRRHGAADAGGVRAGFRPWLLRRLFGALLLLTALITLFVQLCVSIRDRDANRCPRAIPGTRGGWNGRCPPRRRNGISPPSRMSMAAAPSTEASARRASTPRRPIRRHRAAKEQHGGPDHRSGRPPWRLRARLAHLVAGRSRHIGIVVTVIARSFVRDVHKIIPAAEVERTEAEWLAASRSGPADPAGTRTDAGQRGPRQGFGMTTSTRSMHIGLNLGDTDEVTHEQAGVDVFGFWVFLMSDAVVFALLFATYGVMRPRPSAARRRRASTRSAPPSSRRCSC